MYAVGLGWNVALASLTILSPQPRNGEIAYAVTDHTDGGDQSRELFSEPVWDFFETDEEYRALLSIFGLLTAKTSRITWYSRDHAFRWKRYNGIAQQPQIGVSGGRRNFFLREFSIPISDLIALEEV